MRVDSQLAELVGHSDLEQRLRLVPPSAKVRGLYFKSTVSVLEAAGKAEAYRRYFSDSFSSLGWYPCSDFLTRLAVAGALLAGPEQIHQGMKEIGRRNAVAFAESLLGRTMLRLLARDPVRLLRQASAGRRQSYAYGRWEVTFPEPNVALMEMFDEYIWIESNLVGAAIGTLEAIGRKVRVDVELDSPFQGRHILTWE